MLPRNIMLFCAFYHKPHVRPGKPLYWVGEPCTGCPCGYNCDKKTMLCKKKRNPFHNAI
ncbi:hypothetical protein OSTOST_10688 [Ostertagia ostertagi]